MKFRVATLILTLVLGSLAAPLPTEAQKAEKARRVGFLWMTRPEVSQHLLEGFQQGLRELGWVEGQNVAIESRYAQGRIDRIPALAAELVELKADVLVTAKSDPDLGCRGRPWNHRDRNGG